MQNLAWNLQRQPLPLPSSGQIRTQMVPSRGLPLGQICFQQAGGSGLWRKPERADLVPGRGVASGASTGKKNGEVADGEYWPGNNGTRSIKISNKEVIGTGCLAEDFDGSNQSD